MARLSHKGAREPVAGARSNATRAQPPSIGARSTATLAQPSNVGTRILRHNAGRWPDLLAMKYARMTRDPLSFLRATCHLFGDGWDAVVRGTALQEAPAVWSCGDLHLENFGSFTARNRLVCFDVNDFDESALLPLSWDLVRLGASVLVAANALGVTSRQAASLVRSLVVAYADALVEGTARWVELDAATGVVRELLEMARKRTRSALLDRFSRTRHRRRVLRTDGEHALPASVADHLLVRALIREIGRRERRARFFRVLDVARRTSGSGSLGLARWVVLIEGEGAPSGHYLLDVKEARRSVARSHSNCRQRRFSSEAERVMLVQRRAQAHSPALLHAVVVGAASFVARELQPSKDRLHLDSCGGGMAQLCAAMVTMGEVAAWDALRGASRDGAASVRRLRAFASGRTWRTEIGIASRRAAQQSAQEWRAWQKFARHLSAAGLPARE